MNRFLRIQKKDLSVSDDEFLQVAPRVFISVSPYLQEVNEVEIVGVFIFQIPPLSLV